MASRLGGDPAYQWVVSPLLDFGAGDPLTAIFRHTLGLACLSETVSLTILDRNLAAAEEPVAEVLRRIRADEAFHVEVGWKVAAFLVGRLAGDVVAAQVPVALADLDAEFRLPVPPGAACTPALQKLGSTTPEEYTAAVQTARAHDIGARLAALGYGAGSGTPAP